MSGLLGTVGLLAFVSCEEEDDNRIWIEEGKREIVLGADGETDAIRVENVAMFSVEAVEHGDTTYGTLEKLKAMDGASLEVSGDWYYVKLETNDVLIVQVDSNGSHEPRQLKLELFTYNDRDYIHVTQKGQVEPIK